MGIENAYLSECCEDQREGAFRIGDVIVPDISEAVATDFLRKNDVSKVTKRYPLIILCICMVQNEICTFFASCVESWIGVENVVYFSQRFKGRSVGGGTKEEMVRDRGVGVSPWCSFPSSVKSSTAECSALLRHCG